MHKKSDSHKKWNRKIKKLWKRMNNSQAMKSKLIMLFSRPKMTTITLALTSRYLWTKMTAVWTLTTKMMLMKSANHSRNQRTRTEDQPFSRNRKTDKQTIFRQVKSKLNLEKENKQLAATLTKSFSRKKTTMMKLSLRSVMT